MAAEIGGVENQDDGIRLGKIWTHPFENIVSHLLVFRAGMKTVDARKIYKKDFLLTFQLGAAHALLDCDDRKVSHLLMEARQAVEKRGFAAMGRPDNGYDNVAHMGRTRRRN